MDEQKEKINQQQMIRETWENSRKLKRYAQWQLYITIVLVVIPLLALAFIIPTLLKGLGANIGSP